MVLLYAREAIYCHSNLTEIFQNQDYIPPLYCSDLIISWDLILSSYWPVD